MTKEKREAGPGDWQLEAEMKVFPSSEKLDEILETISEDPNAINNFKGTITTHWFNGALPRGVSARVKETVQEGKKKKFYWTIKLDPVNDVPAQYLKNKQEREVQADSFDDAKDDLRRELKHLRFPPNLYEDLIVKKRRISYTFERGAYADLRFDFDELFEGILEKKHQVITEPIRLLEVEDLRNLSAQQKEARILKCLKSFGIIPNELVSSLSTKKLIMALSIVDTVRPSVE